MLFRFKSLLPLAMLFAAGSAQAQSNSHGLDRRNLDTETQACTDFYRFANGGWLKSQPVPPGYASWGLFDELQQRNRLQQQALLERAASAPASPLDEQLGAFYASGMDTVAVNAQGLMPLSGWFERIDKASKPRDLSPLLAELHAAGLPLLFEFGAAPDQQNPDVVIAYARQGGLGLPDRDYYLRGDSQTVQLREAYRAYVERLLALAGSNAARSESVAILELETRLATASLSLLQLRDPGNSYRPTPVSELHKQYPMIDWKKYLRELDLRRLDQLSLAHTSFFVEADALLASLPPAQWQAYLRFHLLHALAPYLGAEFVSAHDQLFRRTLAGNAELQPRPQRVIGAIERLMSEALAQRYVESYLSPEAIARAEAMVESILSAYRSAIGEALWLGAGARQAALAKLDALQVQLVRPEQWRTWDGVELERESYAGNVLTLARFQQKATLESIGKQRPAWQWATPPHSVAMHYDPAANRLLLPAGFLQPPLFDPAADPALNYGAAGALIAHELMHGFDQIGSTFDAEGRVNAWWLPADQTAFTARTSSLQVQYDNYAALGPLMVNGRVTLAENIADLAGLQIAFAAFKPHDDGTKRDEFTPAQRFHLAWAQLWRRNYLDEELRLRLLTDVHPPAPFRVNGPLANLPSFAEAFSCKPGEGLSRPEDARATVW